jgi:hypothetical protein
MISENFYHCEFTSYWDDGGILFLFVIYLSALTK